MSTPALTGISRLAASPADRGGLAAARLLTLAVRFWFVVMLAGQWLFVVHIAGFYGRTALAGQFTAWNKVLATGWVVGDPVGNAVLGMHLALAAYLSFGGALQLIPRLRTRVPRLHRLNGRTYVVTAALGALSALYLSVIRGTPLGSDLDHAASQVNAILILLFAAQAYASARTRQFAAHRRHAIRLFLAVSGVFFFRTEVFSWILVNGGPRGFDPDTFRGPILTAFGFAQYLLPLAVFELYERARTRTGPWLKSVTASVLTALTLIMGTGIVALTGMWF